MSLSNPDRLFYPDRPAAPLEVAVGKLELAKGIAAYGMANGLSESWLRRTLDAAFDDGPRYAHWLKRNRHWRSDDRPKLDPESVFA